MSWLCGRPPARLAVVNPRHIRTLAQAVGRLAKPDRMAARGSAHCAGAVTLAPRPLPEAKPQELRALLGGVVPPSPGTVDRGQSQEGGSDSLPAETGDPHERQGAGSEAVATSGGA